MDAGGLNLPSLKGEAHRSCEIWLEFGDGDYLFRLGLKQLAELQESCGAGIGTIFNRVELGDYHVLDLTEVIRLGLIGGGQGFVNEEEVRVSPEKARRLVIRYADPSIRPLHDLRIFALAIYRSCMIGYIKKDAPPGKAPAARTESEPDGSTSPPPTPMEPLSQSPTQQPSIDGQSGNTQP